MNAVINDTARFPTVEEFENAQLEPDDFVHEAHVYVAWRMLDDCDLLDAVKRYSSALHRITKEVRRRRQVPRHHHLVFRRVDCGTQSAATAPGWTAFVAENPDLISGGTATLQRFYSTDRLCSPLARGQQFLLPDRCPAS